MAIALVTTILVFILLILGIIKEALYTVFPPIKWILRIVYVVLWVFILTKLEYGNEFLLNSVSVLAASFFYWGIVIICNVIMFPIKMFFYMIFGDGKPTPYL